ncbi:hypothetical protein HD595_008063 [Nonomuraea roseoviolacea subsp. carminata]|uniref:Uncharacterized protein n=1 Tax=Nonomuraea roseoviolacea subsp. carminata TaxID=160689 RepID=A0ABT1KD98_9ACTN|nr:hypothetical protein [Nonomuraea roseoviolacea subsp. carminata]
MSVIDVRRFVTDGSAKVEGGAPREVGERARALLWQRVPA